MVDRLAEVARWATDHHGPVETSVSGSGLFDPTDGRVLLFPNLPGPWSGYPLRAMLEKELGRPVHMINDAHAFTLAEEGWGRAPVAAPSSASPWARGSVAA